MLWWLAGSARLGPTARRCLSEAGNTIWVSAVSGWEIAIKSGLGRLRLDEPAGECIPREIERNGFRSLPVTMEHALMVERLPRHHGDPFDRLLVTQARCESLRVATADPAFAAYGVDVLAAAR